MAQREGDDSALTLPKFESPPHLLIVAAPYQFDIVKLLIRGAKGKLNGVATHDQIEVPGSLEIATAIQIAANGKEFDGFVALGCVIRGDTHHFEIVCEESARGLTALGLSGLCIGNGILTVESEAQAWIRADPEKQDKGGDAAAAALHLIALKKRFAKATGSMGFNKRHSSDVKS